MNRFILILTLWLPIASALAGSSSAATQNSTAPSFGGLGFLIAYLTRKREIGGWLFYYYMQLYLSLVFTLVLTVPYISYLEPSKWQRSDLYVWYLISAVPQLVSILAEVAIATYLLTQRNERNIYRLRVAIAAVLIATIISLAIDLKYFRDPSSTVLDGLTVVTSLIWFAYFYRSTRVRSVFVLRNWVYSEAPAVLKTPQERRYLRYRALILAVVFYVLGVVLIGVNEGNKKPDPALLFVAPAIYAGLAALVSYAFPIRKKKREALRGSPAAG